MNLLGAIACIAHRLSYGQTKEEIQAALPIGDSLFFWAWQAATWKPKDMVCCSPMLSRSFRAGCVVETDSGFQNPDVIVYNHDKGHSPVSS